jgi:hypothetical protein
VSEVVNAGVLRSRPGANEIGITMRTRMIAAMAREATQQTSEIDFFTPIS